MRKNKVIFRLFSVMLATGISASMISGGSNAVASPRGEPATEKALLERAIDQSRANPADPVDPVEASLADSEETVRVIIQFQGEPVLQRSAAGAARALQAERTNFRQSIISSGIEYQELNSFQHVFNGTSALVRRKDLDGLRRIKGVREIYFSQAFDRPEPLMIDSIQDVEAPYAWNLGYTGAGLTVGIIDSGFDVNHPDFRLTDPSRAELTASSLTGKGLPGRYINAKIPYAYNYYDRSHTILEVGVSHGQHVAGTVGANGTIRGIAPEAQLLALRVFSNNTANGSTREDIYLKAMDDAVILGADVLNLSLGAPAGFTQWSVTPLDQAIATARQSGVIVAMAVGNDRNLVAGHNQTAVSSMPDQGLVATPALVKDSVAVAAANTDSDPTSPAIASFSTWGSTNDLRLKPEISAPGQNIRSTQNGTTYGYMSGTSMATPHIAGGMAVLVDYLQQSGLVAGKSPAEKARLVKNLLMNSAELITEKGITRSPRLQGAGMMDLEQAIRTRTLALDSFTGEAKLELKEIKDPVLNLNFTLTNFGTDSLTYSTQVILLTDEISAGAYTESSRAVPFTLGGDVNAALAANSSRGLSLRVDFSAGSVPREQFIEGFVVITDNRANRTVLPFMGFYGDWHKPLILDPFAPTAAGSTDPAGPSFFRQAGLLGYASADGKYYYHDPARIELNPGTEISKYTGKGNIIPYLSVLRNTEFLRFRILNEIKATIQEIGSIQNIQKICRISAKAPVVTRYGDVSWSGDIGGGIPEGRYFYEISGQINDQSAEVQSKQIPLIIDYSAPTISQQQIRNRVLTFRASDGDPDRTSGVKEFVISTALTKTSSDILLKANPTNTYSVDVSGLLSTGATQLYVFAYDDLYNGSTTQVPADGFTDVTRIWGATRYQTALEISRRHFSTSDHVIIASGAAATDSLLAGPLSVQLEAPILLTEPGGLSNELKSEILRLGAVKAVIVGGELAVSDKVRSELTDLGITTERLGGSSRYQTSMLIDRRVRALSGFNGPAIIANGYSPFDALTMGAAASRLGVGILLNDGKSIAMLSESLGTQTKAILLGGTLVESPQVEAELIARGLPVERIAGVDRYGTAVAIASRFFVGPDTFILSSGESPYDALAGTILSHAYYAPMLLTSSDSLNSRTADYLNGKLISAVIILGGELRISERIVTQLEALLN